MTQNNPAPAAENATPTATLAPDRTPLELLDLPPEDALINVAGWLDDCDNHVATRRPGGLPMPWFNLFEAFTLVRQAAGRAPPASTWSVIEEIKRERRRQVVEEGRLREGDDEYVTGQLADAAASYCISAANSQLPEDYRRKNRPAYWPWDAMFWKPTTPRRDLVKAAALIVAEIERLDRAEARALTDRLDDADQVLEQAR